MYGNSFLRRAQCRELRERSGESLVTPSSSAAISSIQKVTMGLVGLCASGDLERGDRVVFVRCRPGGCLGRSRGVNRPDLGRRRRPRPRGEGRRSGRTTSVLRVSSGPAASRSPVRRPQPVRSSRSAGRPSTRVGGPEHRGNAGRSARSSLRPRALSTATPPSVGRHHVPPADDQPDARPAARPPRPPSDPPQAGNRIPSKGQHLSSRKHDAASVLDGRAPPVHTRRTQSRRTPSPLPCRVGLPAAGDAHSSAGPSAGPVGRNAGCAAAGAGAPAAGGGQGDRARWGRQAKQEVRPQPRLGPARGRRLRPRSP